MRFLFYLSILSLFISCHQKDKVDTLSAIEIIQKAHARAGGNFWKKPHSLSLKGYGIFFVNDEPIKNEAHRMWRVFETTKNNAHSANGKVRIESIRNGKVVFKISYDGTNTYDLNGRQEKSEADKRWASNFGYGVIRHALEKGYQLQKMEDDSINSTPVYRIKVIDKTMGETFFGIDKRDFKIVKVAFQTPRGWHHRIYSNFFTKTQYSWLQSGKVDLYYNDKLANTIFWEDFEVNEKLPDSLFILKYE